MKNVFSGWRYLWKSQDIRRKLLITLALLVVFRLAANIPVPGINVQALAQLRGQFGTTGTFFDFLDLLSGGTVSRFSLLSMGVYPYITAQIILQLLVPIIPALQRRMEADPREGRKWMDKWTYYLAVPMAALSAIGQINIFNSYAARFNLPAILNFSLSGSRIVPSIAMLFSMVAGTLFAIWLGELISEYGIRGQGLSLIIFAGIVARMPANFASLMVDAKTRWLNLTIMLVTIVATIFAIVYVQQGRRNVPVMYPGRRIGNRMSMPVKGTLPLMVNMAGMIPLIFASAILQFPNILGSYFINSTNATVKNIATGFQNTFSGSGTHAWVYWILYFLSVVI
jgi:preprotein translocase subunit SecY